MNTRPAVTWHILQDELRNCKTEADVEALMQAEKDGPNRIRWLMRMQGRLRVLRADRENSDLLASQTQEI